MRRMSWKTDNLSRKELTVMSCLYIHILPSSMYDFPLLIEFLSVNLHFFFFFSFLAVSGARDQTCAIAVT